MALRTRFDGFPSLNFQNDFSDFSTRHDFPLSLRIVRNDFCIYGWSINLITGAG